MFVKVPPRRQVTLPARVLDALGAKPGDRLLLEETEEGLLLRRRRIEPDRLAPLRHKLRRGHGRFDIHTFRKHSYGPSLRD